MEPGCPQPESVWCFVRASIEFLGYEILDLNLEMLHGTFYLS